MTADLQTEMSGLRREILALGGKVEQRLDLVIEALEHQAMDSAQTVIDGDDEIDDAEVAIEENCLRVLALWQPVATDLRFVLAVLRINTDLERIGDNIRSIAKRLKHMQTLDVPYRATLLIEMARGSRDMLRNSLAALSDADPSGCEQVRQSDDRIDDLQKEVFEWARQEIPAHVDNTDVVIDILSISRKLERVADMATNIAETVIFVYQGQVVRHQH